MKNILITGGAGFIGSHVVRRMVTRHPHYHIYNLDNLTYAGNLLSLTDIERAQNYSFLKADICDEGVINELFVKYHIDGVIHLAAESHVDRSILDPLAFVRTNVLGTGVLLNAARQHWKNKNGTLFYHVSTDEVYGTLGPSGFFTESTAYDPHSPYSASKAGSDHLVRAYGDTFGLPYVMSNCSNNYGPYQFPEKLIPLMIMNLVAGKPLPVYGKGENVRDWLWVEDHAAAIDLIFHAALGDSKYGSQTYNIGGKNEWKNIDLVHLLCRVMDEAIKQPSGTSAKQITFVTDRPGHDLRYAIDPGKIERELGWAPSLQFEEGLRKTVAWYLANTAWIDAVRSGEYQRYYAEQYGARLQA